MFVRRVARATVQPGPEARIDWTHPLGRGLVGVFVPNSTNNLVNLVTSRPLGGTLAALSRDSRGVTARDFQAGTGATSDLDLAAAPWAIAVFAEVANATGSDQPTLLSRAAYASESDNQGWELGGASTGVWRFVSFANNGFGNYNLLGSSSRVNGPVMVVASTDGFMRRLYVNAVEEASTTFNVSAASAVGELRNGSATEQQRVYIAYIWNGRSLSAEEVKDLYAEPFSLLTVPRRMIIVPASSAVSYTIDAQAGSYAVTGTAATLKVGRLVTAEAGSVAVTGTAANLEFGRRLVAEAGSYSVTGTATGVRATRLLTAAAGSYVTTGTAATLRHDLRLSADSGTFVVTGTAASLVYSGSTYTLAAEAGSFAVTGTDASLEVSHLVGAQTGTYSVTGTNAALFATRQLVAQSGSFGVTGVDAGLFVGRVVVAGAGSVALTGVDAGLRVSRRVVAGSGAFVITGLDATLSYSAAVSTVAITSVLAGYATSESVSGSYSPLTRVTASLEI